MRNKVVRLLGSPRHPVHTTVLRIVAIQYFKTRREVVFHVLYVGLSVLRDVNGHRAFTFVGTLEEIDDDFDCCYYAADTWNA